MRPRFTPSFVYFFRATRIAPSKTTLLASASLILAVAKITLSFTRRIVRDPIGYEDRSISRLKIALAKRFLAACSCHYPRSETQYQKQFLAACFLQRVSVRANIRDFCSTQGKRCDLGVYKSKALVALGSRRRRGFAGFPTAFLEYRRRTVGPSKVRRWEARRIKDVGGGGSRLLEVL